MGTRTYSRRGAGGVRVPTALGIRTGRFRAVQERGAGRVNIDRAFNSIPVSRIIQELRDNAGFNLPDIEDTYRERDTGFTTNNQDEMRQFIEGLESAQRTDGSWDLNALDRIANEFRTIDTREVFFPDNVGRVQNFGDELTDFVNRVRQAFEQGGEEAVARIE